VTDAERHRADEPVPELDADGLDADALDADALGADAAASPDAAASADHATETDAPDGSPEGDAPEVDDAVTAEDDPRSRDELLAELMEAESRRDEYLDDLRRARAEFENFRRRTMKEGATQRDLGKAEVLTGMLEVLDDLDRTLEAADSSQDANLAKGIGLVAGKLVQALQAQGLERIDATGVPFDPNLHEAVQQVEAEAEGAGGEPVVAQVLRPGYRAGDRVLRAAMVVVEQ
jgi:molecular chaperone GrpE